MGNSIQERQMELTMRRNERNRVIRRLDGAEAQLKDAIQLRDRLQQQLSKEQQDVIKLGKFSFANKWKEWSGKWDVQMEKEINEVAEAELKYNEAAKTVTDLEADIARLREQANHVEFAYVEEDWADFIKEKETWIRQNDTDANRTLQKIADDRVRVRSMIREINEAYEAGEKALRALDKALDKLGNAEGLSMWDTFLGGGLIVSALKYSEMDGSDDLVHRAQRALRHYETELMDVQNIVTESFKVNQNDIFTFTDIFFDNIFSDWMVHSRISDAKSKLNAVLQDVRRVQTQLGRKRDESLEELRRLDEQERTIIES
ncbi:hypothetical protein [Sporosarcina sp. Te-1]|uniref:hypothetical protein n=1 Tax=Sporosarcina sp. Te-1 TaxID=2818390 RepID=UPI001A9E2E02|nr:hypothetical protein [Sporosarcina sp. Te-1]QTD39979.1 hypothetical protein J3U78_14225 [Sporosarcina sp. Te-1]